ncbi:FAHD2 protein, partial [Corythaixoides concolor]|nr:FAHD2 protein [Corythaixoides concolor]
SGRYRLPRATVRLLAPVADPEKLICVGLNYRDHCLEQGAKVPTEPIIFSKFPSAITGPFDDIVLPPESAVSTPGTPTLAPRRGVQPLRHPPPTTTPFHLLHPRRWTGRWNWPPTAAPASSSSASPRSSPGCPGRGGAGGVPRGWHGALGGGTGVPGGAPADPSHPRFVTLVPGDVLLTGTPPGVGVFRKPPVFLKSGDEVQCEIEELGAICNRVA